MAIAAAIGAIAALASAASSLFGDDSSSSSSTQRTPASWADVGPGAYNLWSDFVTQWFGGGSGEARNAQIDALPVERRDRLTTINDHIASIDQLITRINNGEPVNQEEARYLSALGFDDLLKNETDLTHTPGVTLQDFINPAQVVANPTAALDRLNQYKTELMDARTNEFPEIYVEGSEDLTRSPSMQDMMNQDLEAQRSAADVYTRALEDLGTRRVNEANTATRNYSTRLGEIATRAQTPFAQVSIGGRPLDIVSKRGISLANTLSDLAQGQYASGLALADTKYQTDKVPLDMRFQTDYELTPHAATINYLDKLWPILAQLQGYRFGTQSSVTDQSITPDLATRLTGAANAAQTIGELLADIGVVFPRGGGDTTPPPTDNTTIWTNPTGNV